VHPDGTRLACQTREGFVRQTWAIDNLSQFINAGNGKYGDDLAVKTDCSLPNAGNTASCPVGNIQPRFKVASIR
jgi:hypothetical protein